MTTVIFFEKPGCGNNAKQKALLTAAGHQVLAKNLLTEQWTDGYLRSFFGNRPVADWFNPAAPRVKSGEIVPGQFDEISALRLMQQDPLLIRRPLMEADGRREVGFDPVIIQSWLGLTPAENDLEMCPRSASPCPAPHK